MPNNTVPMTVSEAARHAERSEAFIRAQVDAGRILAQRTRTGVRLIDRASLEEFLRARAGQ